MDALTIEQQFHILSAHTKIDAMSEDQLRTYAKELVQHNIVQHATYVNLLGYHWGFHEK